MKYRVIMSVHYWTGQEKHTDQIRDADNMDDLVEEITKTVANNNGVITEIHVTEVKDDGEKKTTAL